LRVVLDRGRGAGLLGMFFAAAGMFAVVFFTVYYVQGVLGYTALQSGIAFLPLPLTLIATAVVIGPRLSRRFGPRLIVPVGLTISGISVLLMTRIGVDDNYALYLLPTLVLLGLGNGLAFPPSTSNSTLGVKPEDAGVASALVNTTQQVGGSISVAALNTIATTAATAFLVGKTVTSAVVADAAVHSYVIGYWWAAGLFFVGAIVVAALSRSGVPAGLRDPQPEPEAAIIDL
jgi:MFS family permease